MGETSGLIQTIAILAACIVFLAKQAFDFKKRKNGHGVPMNPNDSSAALLRELHSWHKPVNDPETGQPRFMWYEDSSHLREELNKNSLALDELRSTIAKMNDSIAKLVGEIRNQKVHGDGR